MGMGIVGEYIGRIYQEVRRRPRFVIREILESLGGQEDLFKITGSGKSTRAYRKS